MEKKKSQGKTNKRKGSNAEREYALVFRNLGYDKCVTTRNSSRLLDACGVDLNNLPIAVQIKAGHQRGMNISNELQYLETKMDELLMTDDQWKQKPKILIHKKPIGAGKQKSDYHEVVSMTLKDFLHLFQKAYGSNNSNPTADRRILPESVNESEPTEDIDRFSSQIH
jgi:hypothetical protein